MEALLIEEKNTTSLLQPVKADDGFQVSSIFHKPSSVYFAGEYEQKKGVPFFINETIGTTVTTLRQEAKTKTEEDDYEIGYFTDDYDIVAKAPITKSFKVKVKIRSISRLQPKVFIDDDELNLLP
ncbi:MAG: hypothetical protein RBR87_10435 [Bacteroidales bacterium]|jgi:hypothetical protein|nr:hypothetical protein [Bacteroidales bacterium]